jgi:hypothetical protein
MGGVGRPATRTLMVDGTVIATNERVIKLVIHENPDGKYLIKGGGPKVWKKFRLRKEHRRLQGFIHRKRCGVTENIGPAARKRWKDQRKGCDREAA